VKLHSFLFFFFCNLSLFCQDSTKVYGADQWHFIQKKETGSWRLNAGYTLPIGYWAKHGDPGDAIYGYFIDSVSGNQKPVHAQWGFSGVIYRTWLIARTVNQELAYGFRFVPFRFMETKYDFRTSEKAPATTSAHPGYYGQYSSSFGFTMNYKPAMMLSVNAFIDAGVLADNVQGKLLFAELIYSGGFRTNSAIYSYTGAGAQLEGGFSAEYKKISLGAELLSTLSKGKYVYRNNILYNGTPVASRSIAVVTSMQNKQVVFFLEYRLGK
jgi:hypothetical protein